MIYKDGYETNEDLRFVKCPRCGNEEYSPEAKFCRICGFPAYNECEGSTEYDDYGNVEGFSIHKNVGNARFCECCGKPTMLFKEKYLKAFDEIEEQTQDEAEIESLPLGIDDNIPFY